jgi:hypothetical protein
MCCRFEETERSGGMEDPISILQRKMFRFSYLTESMSLKLSPEFGIPSHRNAPKHFGSSIDPFVRDAIELRFYDFIML